MYSAEFLGYTPIVALNSTHCRVSCTGWRFTKRGWQHCKVKYALLAPYRKCNIPRVLNIEYAVNKTFRYGSIQHNRLLIVYKY